MCSLGCSSALVGGIFQKIHASLSPRMRYLWCKFGCDRLLIKDTLPREQSTFSAVSRVLRQWFSWIFTRRTSHACATNGESLVAIGQEWRVLYLEYKVHFRLNVGFHWRDFPIHVLRCMHEIQAVQVWLRSVNNLRHFTWNTQHSFRSISTSIQKIYLKIRTQHFSRMSYKWYKFIANRPLLRTLYLRAICFLGCIFNSIEQDFTEIYTLQSPRTRYK
jgi:hypothetical protein